jgi:RNA polymerase sigma-70 factor (ECF subfamily)
LTITSEYDEKTLLVLVSTGNRMAFTQLYKTYLNILYCYIFSFTRSKDESEEILQNLFVKIWEKREKLAQVESFKGYAFRMANNMLIDNVRRLRIRNRVFSEIITSKGNSEFVTSDDVKYREYYRIVQNAIELLPPKRKLVFKLNIEKGLTYEEIANELNISKSVVKKQAYKAVHFVREYLYIHAEIA